MTGKLSSRVGSSHSVASHGWAPSCSTVQYRLWGVRISVLDGAVTWASVVRLDVTMVGQRGRTELVNHHRLVWHGRWCVWAGVGRASRLWWRVARRWGVVRRRQRLGRLDMWHRSMGHDRIHGL